MPPGECPPPPAPRHVSGQLLKPSTPANCRFLAAAYQPLAAALAHHFVVWGVDLPGHGASAGVPLPQDSTSSSSSHTISLAKLTQCLIDTLQRAGLVGCYAFGHSAGGAAALLAAGQCPGLFSAIYCFEAVVSTPSTHAFMAAAMARGDIQTDGQVLGSMARKRRAVFDSRGAAQQHLASKPPFSRFDPQVVSLYVQHGLVEQGGEGGPVQLVCTPQQEAAYFDALQPPPSVQPGSIHCPVMLAVAAGAPGLVTPGAADLASHAHVQAWFYNQTKQRQLHGSLRVLNIELAAALAPATRLQEVPDVSHFGPLERPQALAELCTRFFKETGCGDGVRSRL